ncbi:secretory protein [Mucilaginibacter sp. Bleaf8]|uniref:basic secretory protein-like protein n=1 Tax=Mucilaginibacter sp. Bleaf8 TaxID=2834430 RepID=UPI001BCCCC09|nr:basic secretory protein-like protein [Mucilaginibacter sp. Bleaf8]MBS7564824.1 secretory protein [Mucilaginibacter sp. Bleaf8]
MKLFKFFVFLFIMIQAGIAKSQDDSWDTIGKYLSRDSITKKGYTLIFINNDSTFAKSGDAIKQRMQETFFEVYPKLAKTYNKKTLKTVIFIIDPNYKGVAATSGSIIRYNPGWMLRTPTDIDVVTHEVMHIVQGYGYSAGPVWLTEGIADYVRYKFGVDNPGAKWSLPDYKASQSYTNSYRITARFFVWVEKNIHKNLVKELDSQLRAHTYTAESWKNLTGKTLDELWSAYTANPFI